RGVLSARRGRSDLCDAVSGLDDSTEVGGHDGDDAADHDGPSGAVGSPDIAQDGRSGRADDDSADHHGDSYGDDQTAGGVAQRSKDQQETRTEFAQPEQRTVLEPRDPYDRCVERTVDSAARYRYHADYRRDDSEYSR